MNAPTLHRDLFCCPNPNRQKLRPASHSFLEPRGEGLLFAFLCILCSAIIYAGVVLIRFLA